MDYQAIVDALDARTLQAFKAWSEAFAKSMTEALAQRDALIQSLNEKIKALEILAGVETERVINALAEIEQAREALTEATQKQVREAIARAPVPTYKGVYDKDAEYQAGDMVTQDGSVWHCNAAVAGEKPGGNEFWTLAVKRGRDGKDAIREGE